MARFAGVSPAAARSAFRSNGTYVQQPLFEKFVNRFIERVRGLKIGAALDYSMDMGSLTSERQLNTVEEHVRDALVKGATTGCRRAPPPGPGAVFLRAHGPDECPGRYEVVCGGNLRTGCGALVRLRPRQRRSSGRTPAPMD